MKATAKGENRFDADASRYAAYLATPEGRLRADLVFANLREFLPESAQINSLRALDLGCGTGVTAARLALLGVHVTLFDSSVAMLDLAQRTVAEAGVSDNMTAKLGDASRLDAIFPRASFDIILCHNLLEFVDDPAAVLCGAALIMRDSQALLSILVRNQAGEVLKVALQMGDLAAAEQNLTADSGQESLYGGKVRLFTPDALEALLQDASLTSKAQRGVRVISDYLPAQITRSSYYDRIFALERKLAQRCEFFGVARYLHCLASWATPASRGRE
jgi:S-adenosylmethionine-dependent methyltransferase